MASGGKKGDCQSYLFSPSPPLCLIFSYQILPNVTFNDLSVLSLPFASAVVIVMT